MEALANLIPTKTLIAVLIASFFPAIASYYALIKAKKEEIITKVEIEYDDVVNDLKEAINYGADALEFLTDGVEELVKALDPESEGGSLPTEAEKANALAMAKSAKEAAQLAIAKLKEVPVIGD